MTAFLDFKRENKETWPNEVLFFRSALAGLPEPVVTAARANYEALENSAKTGLWWYGYRLSQRREADAIRGLVRTLAANRQGADLFPATSLKNSSRSAEVQIALSQFLSHPEGALAHVWDGEIRIDTVNGGIPVIASGMHSIPAFQNFLWRRVEYHRHRSDLNRQFIDEYLTDLTQTLALPEDGIPLKTRRGQLERQRAEHAGTPMERTYTDALARLAVEHDDPTSVYYCEPSSNPVHCQRRHLAEMGFEVDARGMIPFLVGFGDHLGMHPWHNEIVRARFPRSAFRGQAWKLSVGAATAGLMPIGGKTLFPKGWTRETVKDAVREVLTSNESVLQGRPEKFFYVVGRGKKVRMAVGIGQGKVVTAFPIWRQEPPKNLPEVLKEYHEASHRLGDFMESIEQTHTFSRKLTFDDVRAVYLNIKEVPPGLTDGELLQLQALLNPAQWEQSAQPQRSFGLLQVLISEWMQAENALRQVIVDF